MVRRAIIAQQLVCASLRFGVMVRNYLALNYFANHKRSGRASEVVSSQLSFFFLSLKTRNWYSRWRNESKTEKKNSCVVFSQGLVGGSSASVLFSQRLFIYFFRRTWWHRRVDDVAAFLKRDLHNILCLFLFPPRLPGYDGAIKTVVILVCVSLSLSEGSIFKCTKEKKKKQEEENGIEWQWVHLRPTRSGPSGYYQITCVCRIRREQHTHTLLSSRHTHYV